MGGINEVRSGGETDDEFVEVKEDGVKGEELADAFERQIEYLKRMNNEGEKKVQELYIRLAHAHETLAKQQGKESGSFVSKLRLAITFLMLTMFTLAVVNVFSPGALERIIENRLTFSALVIALILTVVVLFLPKPRSALDDTFLEIDRKFNKKTDKAESISSLKLHGSIASGTNKSSAEERTRVEVDDKSDDFPKQVIGASSDFEFCISEIVEYLGEHIKLAESKASKLLDKGTTYLRRGLYFYIGSIVLWQVWGHFVSFDGLVIAGMISTSIAFVIIEFLAAWFLKQYRSFVDSSMAYMRVQSFFNRYLLLYFAARDFGGEEGGDNQARSELLKVMSQEIKWPELKDINANDFNYMIEAMGSMHTSFEKMKGVFQTKAGKSK
ncbi:hypothetical protein [Pseudomonas sp.]|uniref:hypothetical protein n=1 Tax=Pseudomonas sp. TaxID=306 RepID=UPI003C5901C8